MSNDELQKAIDDITRDNAAPVSERASAETEALADEMAGGASPEPVNRGGFAVPPAPAPEVPVSPAMPPRSGQVVVEQSDRENGEVNVEAQVSGFGGPVGAAKAGVERAQEAMSSFQEQLNQQFGNGDVSVKEPENQEEMAPISAFSGVKVEAPEAQEKEFSAEKKRDFGREMDRESVVSDVAREAIKELYPLLDKVEVSADEKFEICMEAAQDTPEAIASALDAARRIEDEKSRAEALLKIVKFK